MRSAIASEVQFNIRIFGLQIANRDADSSQGHQKINPRFAGQPSCLAGRDFAQLVELRREQEFRFLRELLGGHPYAQQYVVSVFDCELAIHSWRSL